MKLLMIALALGVISFIGAVIRYYRPVFRRQCPNCKQDVSLFRAPRPRLIKAFLPFLPIKGYRCMACMQNFVLIRANASRK